LALLLVFGMGSENAETQQKYGSTEKHCRRATEVVISALIRFESTPARHIAPRSQGQNDVDHEKRATHATHTRRSDRQNETEGGDRERERSNATHLARQNTFFSSFD